MKLLQYQLSVRGKLFIFLCVVSLLPMILATRVLTHLGGNSYRSLRELQVRDGSDQAAGYFSAAEKRLLDAVNTVAHWKDLADFYKNPSNVWADQNLSDWAPQSYHLDYMAIWGTDNHSLYQWKPDSLLNDQLGNIIYKGIDTVRSGWISTPQNLYLIAIGDVILEGNHFGSIVFGKRLTHQFLVDIMPEDRADLMVYYGGRLLATTDTVSSLPYVDPGEIFTELVSCSGSYLYEATDENRLIGFHLLENIQAKEIAAIGWSPRTSPGIFIQDAVDNILIYFGIPLVASVLLAALMLGLWIERPIRTLSATIKDIRDTQDLSRRVIVTGGGEISSMSRSFNSMLEQLAKHRDELMTFRTMIQAMKEGVLIEDTNGKSLYMNPRMEAMLGISEDARGEDMKFHIEGMITATGNRIEDEMGFTTEEVEWLKPDGQCVQALKTSGFLKDNSGKDAGILSTFVDITERNDLEIELIETSKMAFLGIFSQGIIHNLNSSLNSIIGYSSLLNHNDPEAEIPQRISEDALRIADQVSLLGQKWLRSGVNKSEHLDLNELIRDEVQFLEADLFFKHNVEKRFELDPDIPCIQGIYGDYCHALLNIIVNGIEAMLESPNHEMTIRTRHDNSTVRVDIQDTGIGIDKENLNKIFLPFFSTKQRGRKEGTPTGAGLGLSTARKVLEPYSVRFHVSSELGRGTTVSLIIPLKRESHIIEEEKSCEIPA
ncbi:hypothetical protein CEE37_04620 [candidate division LCP-89 bacterium B3_LCP]|uniref:histidine kinase n=1 Tax=candidate division LCP-89 bacterium B3_LCP TaxID=2012998 RepID=A0A532V3R4_UNCL8|nr:MAG: hypothetical protein CEE37_04620 [candidate division LCP-89 bacterium B3_LCP]